MGNMQVKTVCGNCGEVAVKVLEEKGMDSRPQGNGMAQDDLPDNAGFVEKRKKGKKRRIHRLTNDQGVIIREVALADTGKSLEEEDVFLCGQERKVLPASQGACASCPGGCCNSKGLPTLIEIEGMAEEDFGGEVLDSGYGAKADLFVVQVKREDGKTIDAFYNGQTGECEGWTLLHSEPVGEKSLEAETKTVGADEARDIAVKSVQGEVVSVDPDQFEGTDAWAVEVNGEDGKSYDVFVSLQGDVLGYDDYGLIADFKSEPEVDVKDGGGTGTPAAPEAPAEDGEVAPVEPVEPNEPAAPVEEDPDKKPEGDEEVKQEEKSLDASEDASFLADLAEFESLDTE